MIKASPKVKGKITYYNNLTGIIVADGQEIPFHKKDFISVFDNEHIDFKGKEIVFNVEKKDGIIYARNIDLIDNNIPEFDESKDAKMKR